MRTAKNHISSVTEQSCCAMLVDLSKSNTNPALQCEILLDEEKIRAEMCLLNLQCEKLEIENEKQKLDLAQQKNDIKISGIDAVMKFQAAMTSLENWQQEDRSLVQQTQEVLKNGFFDESIQNDSLLVVTAIQSVVNS